MNLFLAAVFTNNYREGQARYAKLLDVEKEVVGRVPHILESYHYIHGQKFVDKIREQNEHVFLDSGAFSAHSLGVVININDYCDYIIRNRDILRVEDGAVMASVLDGIGDPLQTWRNQLYMEAYGAKPLPCFHYSEPFEYLDWYVARYSYITIGGLVGKTAKDQQIWLDRIWERMVDGSGRAKLKVHGFGMTSPELMKRYPWHSCDSSSWIQSAAFGNIYTSEYGPISVSKESPARHDNGRHFSSLTTIEQQSLEDMLNRKGFNYERLSTVYESRAIYSMLGYMELNDDVNDDAAANNYVYKFSKTPQLF